MRKYVPYIKSDRRFLQQINLGKEKGQNYQKPVNWTWLTAQKIEQLPLVSQSIYNHWCLKITVHLEVGMEKPSYLPLYFKLSYQEDMVTLKAKLYIDIGSACTSMKECEIRKSLNNFSSESNNTTWLGKDPFVISVDTKLTGSIMKWSDSSGIPFSSLLNEISDHNWELLTIAFQEIYY